MKSVTARLHGSQLTIHQHTALGVFKCCCEVSEDRRQLTKGSWISKLHRGNESAPLQGTFTACRLGLPVYVDQSYSEWDAMTGAVVTFARLEDPAQQGRVVDIHHGLKQFAQGKTGKALEAALTDLAELMADPWIWQLLLRNLLNWGALTLVDRQARQVVHFWLLLWGVACGMCCVFLQVSRPHRQPVKPWRYIVIAPAAFPRAPPTPKRLLHTVEPKEKRKRPEEQRHK